MISILEQKLILMIVVVLRYSNFDVVPSFIMVWQNIGMVGFIQSGKLF